MKRLFTFLFLSIVLLLGACSQSSGGQNGSGKNNGDKVKIGAFLPLTGPAALYGQQVRDGEQLAAKMINDEGGILDGKQIELVVEDEQGKTELAVNAVKKLINIDKVNALAGSLSSSVGMATKDIAKGKILNIITIGKAPDIMKDRDPYRFRLNSTSEVDGKIFHKFIAEQVKPKTMAIIVEKTDYGQAELNAIKKNWSVEGSPKIVATEFVEATDTDFTNPLTKLKSVNADALYVIGSGIEINSAIFKQAHQIGFNDTIKLLGPGNINTKIIELAGKEAVEGVISAELYQNTLENEMNKKFVEAFKIKYNRKPEKMEALGFEAVWFIAKAMDKAGTATDYEKISDTLENNKWESPRGTVDFEKGEALGKLIPLIIKNGEIVPYE